MIKHIVTKHMMDLDALSKRLRGCFNYHRWDEPPLSYAVYCRNMDALDELLKQGAVPRGSFCPAKMAIRNHGCTEFLTALCGLLDGGAEPSSALDWAVCRGNIEVAKICLRYSADPRYLLVEEEPRNKDTKVNNATCPPGEEDVLLWRINAEVKTLLENWSQVDEGSRTGLSPW